MGMYALAAGMVAAPVISGMMAGKAGEKYAARSEAAMQKAAAAIEAVGVPSVEAQQIVLQNPQLLFQFDPELEQVYELEKTKMEQVTTDPKLKDAQMNALEQLQQTGEVGISPEEKSQLNQIRRGTAQEAKARDESILQNLQTRGMGGAGQELAMRAIANQQAMSNASQQGDELASMAYKRALDAVAQGGSLAGNIRGQDFGEQSQIAQAQDAISKFNTANRQDVQGRNIESKNLAALEREKLKQSLEEKRADTANFQEQYNKELIQKKFENEMRKAEAISGAYGGMAAGYNQQGAAAAANTAAMGQGVSSGLGTVFAAKYGAKK